MSHFPIPKCDHEKPVSWSPVIITRWSDRRMGQAKHLIPAPFCEACTANIKIDDFITDEVWRFMNDAIREQGYPAQSRHMSRITWERTADVQRQLDEQKASIASGDSEVLAKKDFSDASIS